MELAVVVAMAPVVMMKMSVHEVVNVISVRDGLVAAVCAVNMVLVMSGAVVSWCAFLGIRRTHLDGVIVDMITVRVM